eukprot:scaffold111999_cov55-Prasinocladus_malaysianus.AAC.1
MVTKNTHATFLLAIKRTKLLLVLTDNNVDSHNSISKIWEVSAITVIGIVDVIQGKQLIGHLGKGSYFGEIAVLQAVTRSASCRAATNCEVSILGKDDLDLPYQRGISIGTLLMRYAIH